MKFLDMKKIMIIDWMHFFSSKEPLITLIPLLGYIVLGFTNAFLFALAMKRIVPSVALAVWMGLSLVGVKLVDIYVFKEPYSIRQLLFFLLIIVGVMGLKTQA